MEILCNAIQTSDSGHQLHFHPLRVIRCLQKRRCDQLLDAFFKYWPPPNPFVLPVCIDACYKTYESHYNSLAFIHLAEAQRSVQADKCTRSGQVLGNSRAGHVSDNSRAGQVLGNSRIGHFCNQSGANRCAEQLSGNSCSETCPKEAAVSMEEGGGGGGMAQVGHPGDANDWYDCNDWHCVRLLLDALILSDDADAQVRAAKRLVAAGADVNEITPTAHLKCIPPNCTPKYLQLHTLCDLLVEVTPLALAASFGAHLAAGGARVVRTLMNLGANPALVLDFFFLLCFRIFLWIFNSLHIFMDTSE